MAIARLSDSAEYDVLLLRNDFNVRVFRHFVHVHVIHRKEWHVVVRFIAGIMLVCWVGLDADRAPVPGGQVGRAGSVTSSGLGGRDKAIKSSGPLALVVAFPQ